MGTKQQHFLDYFIPIPTNTFGTGLTKLLEHNTNGITKEVLSVVTDISVDDITDFEKGKKTPNASLIIKMMEVFKVNPLPHLRNALDKQKYYLHARA